MNVRIATLDDRLAVIRLLDAALLEVEDVGARIEAGDVLVAAADSGSQGRIHGVIVLEPEPRGAHVSAVAVRRRRRDRGVGTALVERALEREGRLTARFDERVRPFYESLDFSIEQLDEYRYRGELGE